MALEIKPTEEITGEDAKLFFQLKKQVEENPGTKELDFIDIESVLNELE